MATRSPGNAKKSVYSQGGLVEDDSVVGTVLNLALGPLLFLTATVSFALALFFFGATAICVPCKTWYRPSDPEIGYNRKDMRRPICGDLDAHRWIDASRLVFFPQWCRAMVIDRCDTMPPC